MEQRFRHPSPVRILLSQNTQIPGYPGQLARSLDAGFHGRRAGRKIVPAFPVDPDRTLPAAAPVVNIQKTDPGKGLSLRGKHAAAVMYHGPVHQPAPLLVCPVVGRRRDLAQRRQDLAHRLPDHLGAADACELFRRRIEHDDPAGRIRHYDARTGLLHHAIEKLPLLCPLPVYFHAAAGPPDGLLNGFYTGRDQHARFSRGIGQLHRIGGADDHVHILPLHDLLEFKGILIGVNGNVPPHDGRKQFRRDGMGMPVLDKSRRPAQGQRLMQPDQIVQIADPQLHHGHLGDPAEFRGIAGARNEDIAPGDLLGADDLRQIIDVAVRHGDLSRFLPHEMQRFSDNVRYLVISENTDFAGFPLHSFALFLFQLFNKIIYKTL